MEKGSKLSHIGAPRCCRPRRYAHGEYCGWHAWARSVLVALSQDRLTGREPTVKHHTPKLNRGSLPLPSPGNTSLPRVSCKKHRRYYGPLSSLSNQHRHHPKDQVEGEERWSQLRGLEASLTPPTDRWILGVVRTCFMPIAAIESGATTTRTYSTPVILATR